MFKKLRKNEKGFTLAELLIVVAIIGVLVAVSIPIFTSQLNKAREATDIANERAAKAAAVAAYLTADEGATSGNTTYYYNASTGEVVASTGTKPAGYGHKYTATQADPVGVADVAKDSAVDNTDKFVQIVITAKTDGTASTAVSWTK